MLIQRKQYVEPDIDNHDSFTLEDNIYISPIRKKNNAKIKGLFDYSSPKLKPICNETNPSLLCLNKYNCSNYTLSCPNSDNEFKETCEDSDNVCCSIKNMRKIMSKAKQTIHRVFSNNPTKLKNDEESEIHINIYKDNRDSIDNLEDYVLFNEEDDCIIGDKDSLSNSHSQEKDKDDGYRSDFTLSIFEILNRPKSQ